MHSSIVFPFSHSVATDDEANKMKTKNVKIPFIKHQINNINLPIALPHPNVLNFASIITPLSSVSNCNFMTSPQAGAPTKPI